MIVFTSDIDWAPEEVIQDMLELFEKYSVKCTLFCTHQSKVIAQCDSSLFEIAIHPNFNGLVNGQGGNVETILDDLLNIFPTAKGVRSHSLTQSSLILQKFFEKKMLYESNTFLPYQKNIIVSKLWNGLIRIPYNWGDDAHWAYNKSFDSLGLDINSKDLKVLDFHPIHVYLNTDAQNTYDQARQYYQDASKLKLIRNTKALGVRDLLQATLKHIHENNIETYKMMDLCMPLNDKK
jgi:hypothetical protein